MIRGRQFGQRDDIPRQRAAGKRTAGAEIGPGPDPRLAFQAGGNLLRVRTDVLAQSGHLVDVRDGKREDRIKGVLHHFRRLGAHEHDLLGERGKQFFD